MPYKALSPGHGHARGSPSQDSICFITSALNNPPPSSKVSPLSSKSHLSSSTENSKRPKKQPFSPVSDSKKKSSLLSFLSVKEPSNRALLEYEQALKKQQPATGDGPSPAGLAMVSDAKMPPKVPKVNSKWDGVPKAVSEREKEKKRKHSSRTRSRTSPNNSLVPSSSESGRVPNPFSTTRSERNSSFGPSTQNTSSSTISRSPPPSTKSRDSMSTARRPTIVTFKVLQSPQEPHDPSSILNAPSTSAVESPSSTSFPKTWALASSVNLKSSSASVLLPSPLLATGKHQRTDNREVYQPLPRINFMQSTRAASPTPTSATSSPPEFSPVTPGDQYFNSGYHPFSAHSQPAMPFKTPPSPSISLRPTTPIFSPGPILRPPEFIAHPLPPKQREEPVFPLHRNSHYVSPSKASSSRILQSAVQPTIQLGATTSMDTTESTAPWDSPEPIEMMMQRMSDGSPAPASLSQATDGSTLAPWDSSEPIEAMMQRMSGVSVNYPRSLTPKLVSNATCNEPKTSREGKKRMAFLR